MRRREFITLLGGAAVAWPALVRGQQPAMPVIGLLGSSTREGYVEQTDFFLAGLKEAGFVDGQNLRIEYRWADEHLDRLSALAADLVRRQVAVIFAIGGSLPVRAAMAATTTIPIVFFIGTDPVKSGFVASLDHPGGNVTGVGGALNELGQKRLETLRRAVPNATPIAALLNPDNPNLELDTRAFEAAGRSSGVELVVVHARGNEQSLNEAFASMAAKHVGGLVVNTEPTFSDRRSQIIALAAQYRIPAIYASRQLTGDGGLMSFGAVPGRQRDAGRYVARILKGEKPADLPVLLPTKFDLAINLKTAKALGLTIPELLLAEADEVIK